MADDFFSDPFDDIVKQFFGESSQRRKRASRFTEGEEEERVIDFIESEDKLYVIFELPGYEQKDVAIIVKDKKIEINARKNKALEAQEYLSAKFMEGINIVKTIPSDINIKKFSHTVKNGILEISFDKK